MMITWLDKEESLNIGSVGGKGYSLARMIQDLSRSNVRVPKGFVLTTSFFEQFIEQNLLGDKISSLIDNISHDDLTSLAENGKEIRRLIQTAHFTPEQQDLIIQNYQLLSKMYSENNVDVGVRSSAIGEDGFDHSWAGQLDTFLNIRGHNDLIQAIKNCFASIYTDRLIVYRRKITTTKISMAVVIQKMVKAQSSGVAFSIDTESGFRDVLVINGSYGLGESIVQGAIDPDEFIVHKPTLAQGFNSIIDRKLGRKQHQTMYGESGIIDIPNTREQCSKFCINDNIVLELAQRVISIEKYYSEKEGKYCPVDVEWAVENNVLYIVQARSETTSSKKNTNIVTEYSINSCGKNVLLKGVAVGNRVGSGKVRVIESIDCDETRNFNDGDVLVVDQTTPDWEPLMIKASAIVCNRGGRTCHAAIIAREYGITAVVGTHNGTQILSNNQFVTVSCAEGENGFVYDGYVEWTTKDLNLDSLPSINTKLMLNIANPSVVFKYFNYPVQGVGLVREEFIINNYVQVHPNALIDYDKLNDQDLIESIDKLMIGYSSPTEYYVNKLCCGIARIAATFYQKDVIVRFSDFKSNEYANLLGGKYYESLEEQNPMIGFRGASRYYDPKFKTAFGLECQAIKKLRDEMGFTNIIVMIPFCRTIKECELVLDTMAEFGLVRGVNGLKVYIMCEIPANVILADEFCKRVDGFSIGSNDLTQMVLGLDRDSELITHLYDEKNDAVQTMITMAIDACKRSGTKIGICGQGPSDHPDFAEFLVRKGIDSISVTPDSVFKTVQVINSVEQEIS